MDTCFDQTLASDVSELINSYTQHADTEALDALLALLEKHSADEIIAATISAALEYVRVWSNQQ